MNIVQVLGIIIASDSLLFRSPEVVEGILGMEEGELKLVLRGLSSLMEDRVTSNIIPRFAHASFRDYLFNPSRSGPFHVNREEYENQLTIRSFAFIMQLIRSWRCVIIMIFNLLIIHHHDRMSSITQVLHTATWHYFILNLPVGFVRSPKVVKEAIMTDINDLVQEFCRTSSDVGASFFAMHFLLQVLEQIFEVCSDIIAVLATAST